MNRLFIAEKPSLGRAIAAHLSKPQNSAGTHIVCGDDVVTWCVGHILNDFKPEEYSDAWSWKGLGAAFNAGTLEKILPMVPGEFKLRPNPDLKKQFDAISTLAKQAHTIVHAGDIDREGQLIVDEVLEYIGNRKPVLRLDTSSLDDVNLSKALRSLTDNASRHNTTLAGYARREADWLFGMNFTVAYTFAARKGGFSDGVLNVGRVKTPTMRLVVDRDNTIDKFRPVPYFVLNGQFETSGGARFAALWKPDGEKVALDPEKRLLERGPADAVAARLTGAPASVKSYKDEEKTQGAPLPYSLSDLQADASRRFGFPVNRTLELAQKLYEAKITSYPRTDARYLPEAQHADAAAVLANVAAIYPAVEPFCKVTDARRKSAAWNDKKVTAHHAIVPTQQRVEIASLGEDERKIYDLIVRRYIAQFLPECRYRQVSVELDCNGERFTASGRTPVGPGWKVLYGGGGAEEEDEKAGGDDESAQAIPKMATGDTTTCRGGEIGSRETKPPRRFTEGTLVKAMANIHEFVTDPEIRKRLKENDGIGTEATRGPIIEDLKRREFFVTQGKNIVSSPRARAFIAALNQRVTSYDVTALFESNLSKIEDGSVSPAQFLDLLVNFVGAGCTIALQSKVVIPPGTLGAKKSGGRGKPRGGGKRAAFKPRAKAGAA
jgi:DNA topoisomerase-3